MTTDEIKVVLRDYPGLRLLTNLNKVEGVFALRGKNGSHLAEYPLRIVLRRGSFRTRFPRVILLDDSLTRHEDRHIYQWGELCLATEFAQRLRYRKKRIDLQEFLENVLSPFLATQTLIEEGIISEFPQGERSHGSRGVVEEYALFFKVEEPEEIVLRLRAYLQKQGRNSPCFCGSGAKYKKCHLAEVQSIAFAERSLLKRDLKQIE